jgi:hypothetical protein
VPSDVKLLRGDIMHGYMHGQGYCDCTPWESLTKKQKLEIMREKKKWLEAKTKNVAEAIKELEKGK